MRCCHCLAGSHNVRWKSRHSWSFLSLTLGLYCLAARAFSSYAAVVAASESTDQLSEVGKEGDEGAQINLRDLSDSELEAICTSRGFELVREIDEATGKPVAYSHDDYVDAAKECLDLEAEMETFFEKNPDLLGDLKVETEAMAKEKEMLERRLAEAQKNLDKEKSGEEKESSKAFVTDERNADKSRGNDYLSSLAYGEDAANGESSKGDKASETSFVEEDEKGTGEGGEEEEDESEPVIDLDENTEGEAMPASENADKTTDNGAESGSSTGHDSTKERKGPLTMARLSKETILEFRDKVQRDLTRIGEIVLPKPLRGPLKDMLGVAYRISKDAAFSTASLLKRYLGALLDSAKKSASAGEDGEENSSTMKRYFLSLKRFVNKFRSKASAASGEKKSEGAGTEAASQ